jgi:hypothetical protein
MKLVKFLVAVATVTTIFSSCVPYSQSRDNRPWRRHARGYSVNQPQPATTQATPADKKSA